MKYHIARRQQQASLSVPAWFDAMTANTWIEVAAGAARTDLPFNRRGNRLIDVDVGSGAWNGSNPSLQAILDAFGSAAVYQAYGELIVGNVGGHASREGNDMYGCDIRSETPQWRRLSNPSSSVNSTGATLSAWSDNTPKPPHGWWRMVCANDGRIWWPTMDAFRTNATPPNDDLQNADCWTYNRPQLGERPAAPVAANTAGLWTYRGLSYSGSVNSSSHKYGGAGSIYDSTRNQIWTFANFDVDGALCHRIDASYTGTSLVSSGFVTNFDPVQSGGRNRFGDMWGVHTPDSRDVLILGLADDSPGHPGEIAILNPASPGAFVYKAPTGTPVGMGGKKGAVYHNGAIYFWDEGFGANLGKLTVPANPLTDPSSAWTWSTVTPHASNTVTPSSFTGNSGTYGKFNKIDDMGNGQAAFVLVVEVDEPVWVFKPG
jgi:hypothetical protein